MSIFLKYSLIYRKKIYCFKNEKKNFYYLIMENLKSIKKDRDDSSAKYSNSEINQENRINNSGLSEVDSLISCNEHNEQKTKNQDFQSSVNENSLYSILMEILLILPIFIGFICYYLTLEPCIKDYDTCLTELDKAKISKLLTLAITCVACLSFKIFLIIHFNIKYRWIKLSLILLKIAYLTLIYDTGNDFKSHGAYNRLFLYFGIPVGYLGYFILLKLYILNQKYGNRVGFTFLFVLFLLKQTK